MTRVLIVDDGRTGMLRQALLRRLDEWCHCAGQGYWYEQVDGPHNRCVVKCEKHWKPEMQEAAERSR